MKVPTIDKASLTIAEVMKAQDEFAQIAIDGIKELQGIVAKQKETIEQLSRELAAANTALDTLDRAERRHKADRARFAHDDLLQKGE